MDHHQLDLVIKAQTQQVRRNLRIRLLINSDSILSTKKMNVRGNVCHLFVLAGHDVGHTQVGQNHSAHVQDLKTTKRRQTTKVVSGLS